MSAQVGNALESHGGSVGSRNLDFDRGGLSDVWCSTMDTLNAGSSKSVSLEKGSLAYDESQGQGESINTSIYCGDSTWGANGCDDGFPIAGGHGQGYMSNMTCEQNFTDNGGLCCQSSGAEIGMGNFGTLGNGIPEELVADAMQKVRSIVKDLMVRKQSGMPVNQAEIATLQQVLRMMLASIEAVPDTDHTQKEHQARQIHTLERNLIPQEQESQPFQHHPIGSVPQQEWQILQEGVNAPLHMLASSDMSRAQDLQESWELHKQDQGWSSWSQQEWRAQNSDSDWHKLRWGRDCQVLPYSQVERIITLCKRFNLNTTTQDELIEVLGKRINTFQQDIDGLVEDMTKAYNPSSLIASRIMDFRGYVVCGGGHRKNTGAEWQRNKEPPWRSSRDGCAPRSNRWCAAQPVENHKRAFVRSVSPGPCHRPRTQCHPQNFDTRPVGS